MTEQRLERVENILRACQPPRALGVLEVLDFWGPEQAAVRVAEISAEFDQSKDFGTLGAAVASAIVDVIVALDTQCTPKATAAERSEELLVLVQKDSVVSEMVGLMVRQSCFASTLRQAGLTNSQFESMARHLVWSAISTKLLTPAPGKRERLSSDRGTVPRLPFLRRAPIDGTAPSMRGLGLPLAVGGGTEHWPRVVAMLCVPIVIALIFGGVGRHSHADQSATQLTAMSSPPSSYTQNYAADASATGATGMQETKVSSASTPDPIHLANQPAAGLPGDASITDATPIQNTLPGAHSNPEFSKPVDPGPPSQTPARP